MLKLDHLTIVAPTLAEGVAHVRQCLNLDVPFGQRHPFMGTYNHLLQLGGTTYLEIIAIDPDAEPPAQPRWFGLDDGKQVRSDWDRGRRLRGWVARTDGTDAGIAEWSDVFGRKVPFPPANPTFDFFIRQDGALPLDGAAPSVIDRRGKTRSMTTVADLGATLRSYTLEHPNPAAVEALYQAIGVDRPPYIVSGSELRYRAQIETPNGVKELT